MEELCQRKLRGGTECHMGKDHRGICSSVAFWCDGCQKIRRGRSVARAVNPWDDVVEAEFCWFCMNVTRPWEE